MFPAVHFYILSITLFALSLSLSFALSLSLSIYFSPCITPNFRPSALILLFPTVRLKQLYRSVPPPPPPLPFLALELSPFSFSLSLYLDPLLVLLSHCKSLSLSLALHLYKCSRQLINSPICSLSLSLSLSLTPNFRPSALILLFPTVRLKQLYRSLSLSLALHLYKCSRQFIFIYDQ